MIHVKKQDFICGYDGFVDLSVDNYKPVEISKDEIELNDSIYRMDNYKGYFSLQFVIDGFDSKYQLHYKDILCGEYPCYGIDLPKIM